MFNKIRMNESQVNFREEKNLDKSEQIEVKPKTDTTVKIKDWG